MCHLDNVLIFKDLSDDDISEVETFVRDRMLTILKSKKDFHASENNMIQFFGETFAYIPNQFIFRIGDKKLIKLMISHVQKFVDDGNIGHFKSAQKKDNSYQKKQHMSDDAIHTYYFLDKLKTATDQNANRERGGYRYDAETKQFASYLRIISGPLAYDTLQKNLKCALPSLPSTNRYIQSSNCKPLEGLLRSEELLNYLTSRNLPLKVALKIFV